MRRFVAIFFVLFLAAAPLVGVASSQGPPYARVGAAASYTAEGGFIAYFSGVLGNITYTVTSLFPNGTMLLHVYENITAGQDLPPFITTFNKTDSVSNPHVFPVVPLSNLSSGRIFFQNVSSSFLVNNTASVPAGVFNTMEFQGKGPNGTTYSFWFDRTTGLVVEENGGASVVELESTNVATPIGPPSGLNGEIPYELVFVIAFAVGGSLFLWIRHHYGRSAAKAKESNGGKRT